jgi:Flp pilus assembly protein TadG
MSQKPENTKRSFLTRLVVEEEGQAMVEFVVLLPVYLLLIVGMIYMGHLMIIRQQVVEASRWYAWSNNRSLNFTARSRFFSRFSGRSLSALGSINNPGTRENQVPVFSSAFSNEADPDARTVARELLLNSQGNGTNLVERVATARFDYTFPLFTGRVGMQSLSVPCTHTVYAYKDISRRREITSGTNYPIIRYTGRDVSNSLQAFNTYADPYEPVRVRQGQQFVMDSGSGHENHACFWNRKALLGKNVGNPFFYHPSK